ncbi:hypothetical protein C8R46DRAFT_1160555 [Mycena filopes]|nr:hypothetical protein C8R46DRAFT_1160555 [Mycena filopes]
MTEYTKPPLDETIYKTADEDLAFIKAQTGIEDPDVHVLKEHIIAVQAKAYDLYGHHCIRSFAFTRTKISTFPVYPHVLALGRQGGILLDLGCCFGTDIRKAAADGFPAKNLIASDLRPAFWNLGHELFKTSPEIFPIAFLAGDALDPKFLEPAPPLASTSEAASSPPSLNSIDCLTPLRGHVSAIHISSVFHLFFEPDQLKLARSLAGLLSPAPGSVIFGSHVGRRIKGFNMEGLCSGGHHMFCHSPESWRQMCDEVFPEGAITVQVAWRDTRASAEHGVGMLTWSVTRA